MARSVGAAPQTQPSASKQRPSGGTPMSAHTGRFASDLPPSRSNAVTRPPKLSPTIGVRPSLVMTVPLGTRRSSATTRSRSVRVDGDQAGRPGIRMGEVVESEVADISTPIAVYGHLAALVRCNSAQGTPIADLGDACRGPVGVHRMICRPCMSENHSLPSRQRGSGKNAPPSGSTLVFICRPDSGVWTGPSLGRGLARSRLACGPPWSHLLGSCGWRSAT